MRMPDISPGSARNSPAEDNITMKGNLWNKVWEEIAALLPADRNRTVSAANQRFQRLPRGTPTSRLGEVKESAKRQWTAGLRHATDEAR